jgi:phosphatidylglycerol:prolipoprotein diacylglycerol transferase
LEYWHNIYEKFDPVAFNLFGISVHWYGITYVLALLLALLSAKYFVKKDKLPITNDQLDNYFIWVEVGVILGARIGYILFYSPQVGYYLTNPWQMFNPFMDGNFVGIRGFSYHGALIGFLIASYFYSIRSKLKFWFLMDLVAISVPLGYIFGRIGNFLNQELVGRVTDVPWGIYVYGDLRHPSQLYEALLEGLILFLVIYLLRKRKRFHGELAMLYAFGYGLARFVAEFWREPDIQLGFIYDWLTMGQILSLTMMLVAVLWYIYLYRNSPRLNSYKKRKAKKNI